VDLQVNKKAEGAVYTLMPYLLFFLPESRKVYGSANEFYSTRSWSLWLFKGWKFLWIPAVLTPAIDGI